MRNPLSSVELGFSGLADIRIPCDFMADCGFRPMPWQDARRWVERKDFFANPIEKERTIAAWQIPAAHALAEKDIARHEQTLFGKVKAQTSRAMPWHMEAQDFQSTDRLRFALLEEQIRRAGFVLDIESMLLKKSPISKHRDCVWVKSHPASMAALNFCGIHHMVEMPMCENKPIDLLTGKVLISTLGSVEKNVSRTGLKEIGVGVQRTTGKNIERLHVLSGRMMRKRRFDFCRLLCKIFDPSIMNFSKHAIATIFTALAFLLPARAEKSNAVDQGQVALAVANWLQQAHYSRKEMDAEMSAKLLATYLELLDYNKLYFTQQDVDEFTLKYGESLHKFIRSGDLSPAREIFQRFKERVENRVATNKNLAAKKYDFQGKREVELNRQKSPWPKTLDEADKIWRDRVEAELLQEHLSELKLRSPEETVTRRYDQALRNVREMSPDDVTSTFLKALTQSYDPHSEYMSPTEMENFQINMKLSLVGIGAVLRSEDGYTKIMEIVPGGPADRDGRLKVGDRILAVGQGEKEFEDVVDMKLDKVVEKIRGAKNSVVRLQVIPNDADDPSKRSIVEITRDEVKLKDQEAKAELLDVTDAVGKVARIGWITLPSFYANMSGDGEPKSTTVDVEALLTRLKKENIEGLVIDLRRDGGGSLEEAINLTGLFIPQGPVVQAKDPSGKITVNNDKNPEVSYSGPMIVLMNRLSASASEIFAAALQDYGRALVVGDERSFGKGTVQTIVDLDKSMSLPFFNVKKPEAGALKLTIQKFYRILGGSTQIKGVESDIVLPSRTDNAEIGEDSLKNPLDYDEVAPVVLISKEKTPAASLFVEELRERSKKRIQSDQEFIYVNEDMQRFRERIAKNTISTNEDIRRKELADEKKRKEARKQERAARGSMVNAKVWQVTLDDVKNNREDLEVVAYERERDKKYNIEEESDESEEEKKEAQKTPEPDPIRNEAVRIISDLIELSNPAKTAKVSNSQAAAE